MKKSILTITLFCTFLATINAQEVQRNQEGNFVALTKSKTTVSKDSTTTFTYTDGNGKTEPVYVGSKGSYYVARTSKKSGNYYRKYLKAKS
jgi:hypothetical protein